MGRVLVYYNRTDMAACVTDCGTCDAKCSRLAPHERGATAALGNCAVLFGVNDTVQGNAI